MEKAHPAPSNQHRPTKPRRHWTFCTDSKTSLREECVPTQTRLVLHFADAGRPCGPVMCFLRARCSWSALNKGNGNVTATVNLFGRSCQQDGANQSRECPRSQAQHIVFVPPAKKTKKQNKQKQNFTFL